MLASTEIYIDLGTANTLIYAKRQGLLLNESSVLALRHGSARQGELFALGRPAKLMLGKNPPNLSIHRPLKEGVIADFDGTARMLHSFIKRTKQNIRWFRPRMIISLPCRVTQYEKRAVEQVGYELGAHKVCLLDEPVAAAIGSGLEILSSRGKMIVDVGGGTTEMAVISLGGIVTSNAIRVGGDKIDEAIVDHLRSRYKFLIGEQTAERIKISVGSAIADDSHSKSIEIGGINLAKTAPQRFAVDTRMIFPAIEPVIEEIAAAIRTSLELCPPEVSADIAEDGFVIAGGGSLLRGLPGFLERNLGIKVRLSDEPLLSVALGGARALEDSKLFDALDRPA
jgi:rod shape-determining protein MreB and related proteins